MPLNSRNGRFDVQVQFAATDLYGDLLGYFQRPKNYGETHVINWLYATDSGVFNNTASGISSTVAGPVQHRQRQLQRRRRGGYNTAGGDTRFARRL